MSAVATGVTDVAQFTVMATFQAIVLAHQGTFIAASVGWFQAFNTFIFKGTTTHDPTTLWGVTISVCVIVSTIVGFLTWRIALTRAEKGESAGEIQWKLLDLFGRTAMIVCVFALDNAIKVELNGDVESTSAFVLCLTIFAVVAITALKFVVIAIKCCFLQGCCKIVSCGQAGSSPEVFEKAKTEATNQLVSVFTFCLSYLLSLHIVNALLVVVIPQVSDESDQTIICWALFVFLLVVSLSVMQIQRIILGSLKTVESGTPVNDVLSGACSCILRPCFALAGGGYQSVGYFGFLNSTCVYAMNFNLYIAVYQTLSSICGEDTKANSNALLVTACMFSIAGGIIAFGSQMYLAKSGITEPAVLSFAEDSLKFLVQGFSYVIGKLWWFGWAMELVSGEEKFVGELVRSSEGVNEGNWQDLMKTYIHLSIAFTVLGFLSTGLVTFMAMSTGGAKSSRMQQSGDADDANAEEQSLAKKKVQKKLII